MDRRAFINWVGVGFIASFLPVAIAACGSDNSTANNDAPANTNETADSGDGNFQPVGAVSMLDSAGQITDQNSPVGPVVVIRNPDSPDSLVALNPTCTHAGCAVEWQSDQKIFACPCHGSQFDATGAVVNGPASRPLAAYNVRVEGEQVLVSS